jgi:hypothetical protein
MAAGPNWKVFASFCSFQLPFMDRNPIFILFSYWYSPRCCMDMVFLILWVSNLASLSCFSTQRPPLLPMDVFVLLAHRHNYPALNWVLVFKLSLIFICHFCVLELEQRVVNIRLSAILMKFPKLFRKRKKYQNYFDTRFSEEVQMWSFDQLLVKSLFRSS